MTGVPSAGRRWIVGVAAVATLATGVLAVRNSFALAMTRGNPILAARVDTSNGAARGQAALTLIQADQTPAGRDAALVEARAAIVRDPTSSAALSVVGLAAPTRAGSLPAFVQSEALSRRGLPAQLWLIEDAVTRDDVAGALRHYDVALRTSRTAPSLLFPVLIGAVSDRSLLVEIARTLASRPRWGGLFLQQLAQSGTDLPPIATLFQMLNRRGVEPGLSATATLYQRLVDAKQIDAAWALYRSRVPGAQRGGIRNNAFTESPTTPSPFDWNTADDVQVTARIETGSPTGRLVFSGASGEGGDAAHQLLLLAPGRHRFQVEVATLQAPSDARPSLRLVCTPGGSEIARQPLPNADERPVIAGFDAVIPAGCAAQQLILGVQAPTSMDAVEGALTRITVD